MPTHLDRLTRSLDAPMVIVTAGVGDETAGCLVGFHGQVSIDPLRWGVWISAVNHTHDVIERSPLAAVHFLSEHDGELAALFGAETGDDVDKFARCAVARRVDGTPLLERCDRVLVGPIVDFHRSGGDHSCVVVEPTQIRCDAHFDPLRFGRIDDLLAGHPVEAG